MADVPLTAGQRCGGVAVNELGAAVARRVRAVGGGIGQPGARVPVGEKFGATLPKPTMPTRRVRS